jgi:hypothetical protein
MRLFVFLISLVILKSSCQTEEITSDSLSLTSCKEAGVSRKTVGLIAETEATISFLTNDGSILAIVPNNDKTKRYVACNLPKEAEKDGIGVIFTANELEILPNERLAGTPIELKSIKLKVIP